MAHDTNTCSFLVKDFWKIIFRYLKIYDFFCDYARNSEDLIYTK